MRKVVDENVDEFRGDLSAIYAMGTYLVRRNMLIQNELAAPLRRNGIIKLYELYAEDETQMNRNERIKCCMD